MEPGVDLRKYYENWAEIQNFEELPAYDQIAIRRRAEVLADLVVVPDGANILDVGCGEGIQMAVIETKRCLRRSHLIGIDIAFGRLQRSYQRVRAGMFGTASTYHLPFRGNRIDCIICAEVLEHLPRLDLGVQEMYRVLKSGGKLIISVPFEQKIGITVCIHCGKPTPAGGHLHSFDANRLRSILEEAGFIVERCRGIIYAVPFFAWLPYQWWKHAQVVLKLRYRRPKYLLAVAVKPFGSD